MMIQTRKITTVLLALNVVYWTAKLIADPTPLPHWAFILCIVSGVTLLAIAMPTYWRERKARRERPAAR